MANGRLTKTLRDSNGVIVSGQSLYIVTASAAYDTDTPMTENPSKSGEYYRDSLARGRYDIYNSTDTGTPILSNYYHTGDLLADEVITSTILDGAVTPAKTSFADPW